MLSMREVVSVSDLFLFSLFSLLLHVLATGCFIYDPTTRQNYDPTTSVCHVRFFLAFVSRGLTVKR